ncbi:hypothetical protein F6476_01125 [Pseudomonas umsongensis]|jgi:hypothetical protein|uniref:Transmembrane protein n=1 Tax=Pseudomonas migulae TaxID=78543 RepID=A0A1H5FHT5_9PSED|nr:MULTISPECIES: hypothetical protein [Pseudomonas]MBU0520782.1 hypothetical protein [Gammaproteobacteria bacterium]SEB88003.1 hypothetical protein SAMN04490199_3065 [Pseudomonas marginalis]KRP75698.1 hypothetical protein TU80_19580 [Pseudomonas veronii]MBU0844516.1 hypothetical protein [Gammaproteobacteria bacterium]MBU1840198.1 hypothetical protein [Gammaproteobacteria bacterium]
MNSPMKSPLTGRPPTRQTTDEAGLLSFKVTPRELTPIRAKLANGISSVIGLGLAAVNFIPLLQERHLYLQDLVAAIGVTVLGYYLLRWVTLEACRVTTRIELRMDQAKVRRLSGWESYDRRIEHRFVLLPHDEAEHEQRCHDLATRKAAANGQVLQPPIYYGDSFHVVLVYAGHRIDLMTVYGRQQAAAIVARLQHCDQILDAEAKRVGAGKNPHIDGEWPHSPGGLNDV